MPRPIVARSVIAVFGASLVFMPTLSSQASWTIRLRMMQSPLPVGSCAFIEVVPRDGKGQVPLRPDGMQISWQDFEFAITSGAGFAWRNNNPRTAFICANAPDARAVVTVTYPGQHLSGRQTIPGVRVAQRLEVVSAPTPAQSAASAGSTARPGSAGASAAAASTSGTLPTAGPGPPSPPAGAQGPRPAPSGATTSGTPEPEWRPELRKGDFSDVVSMLFGDMRFVDAAHVVVDSPIETHELTNTALRYTTRLPTQDVIRTDITTAKNRPYRPTRLELADAAAGRTLFGVAVRHLEMPDAYVTTLDYVAPDQAPAPRERQQTRAAMLLSRLFEALVPPVLAQGINFQSNTATSVSWRIAKLGLKTWQSHRSEFTQYTGIETTSGPALNFLLKGEKYTSVAMKYAEIVLDTRDMVNVLRAKRKCVENPTSPLTRREYDRNPSERQKALDAVDSAEQDITMNGAVRSMNVTTGVLGGLASAGPAGGVALGETFSKIQKHNDQALKEASQASFDDAMKSVVGCDEPRDDNPEPVRLLPMVVTVVYKYNRRLYGCSSNSCGGTEISVESTAEVLMQPSQFTPHNYTEGVGLGTWKRTEATLGDRDGGECGRLTSKSQDILEGPMSVTAEAARVPGQISALTIKGRGDAIRGRRESTARVGEVKVWTERWGVKRECEVKVKQEAVSVDGVSAGFRCTFTSVDLIHGGTYATFSRDDQGYGTCIVTLAPAGK